MKNNLVLCFVFLISFAFTIHAQILNAGFENWNANGDPLNWTVSNSPPDYVTITKSSDAHSGSWAAEGNVAAVTSFNVAPALYSGEEGDLGIPINSRPASLEGYYKLTSAENDFLQIQVFLYKNGSGVGVGAKDLNVVGSYTKFNCDIVYFVPGGDVPDTALIIITVANSSFFTHVGTKMFIDDLSWSSTTDISNSDNQIPNKFSLGQNYPNPFNPSTRIQYQVSSNSQVNLKVYDVLGNEVATLVDEYKPAGNYEIEFSAENLSSGIYFYKLQSNNFVETKKMILLR
jgi:hypothetical protein